MPLKKPNLRPLAMSLERQNSVQMSDTGSLALDNFVIGRNGITQSPLQLGEHDPHLRLQDLVMQRQLGRGMSSKVYLMVHRPTGKPVAVKVLQSNAEQDRESRQMVLNEVRTVFAARSDHLVAFYDAFHHEVYRYLPRHLRDTSETPPRHLRDTSETPPRHLRDTSETPPRHLRDTSETPPRHLRDTSETLPRHLRDTT